MNLLLSQLILLSYYFLPFSSSLLLFHRFACSCVRAMRMYADKVFSFLSQDEVEKLKQEEEKKIETLKRDKKNKKLLRASDGNNLEAGDDNVDGTSSESDSDSADDDDDDNNDDNDDIHAGDSKANR